MAATDQISNQNKLPKSIWILDDIIITYMHGSGDHLNIFNSVTH